MIADHTFAAAGWPIGSGSVERAHQHVLQARMKGPGMRWGLPTAQAMIALRVILANDRWEQIWPRLAAQQGQTRQTRTAQRRRDRRAAVAPTPPATPPPCPTPAPVRSQPTPKLVQNGRPTAAHPWRQALLRRSRPASTKM